jgi:excisionase family DNA binding protein
MDSDALAVLDTAIQEATPAERAGLVVQLAARLATLGAGLSQGIQEKPVEGPDVNVDVGEASRLLGVSKRFLYRAAPRLPFARRLGRRLLFSRTGLERWNARHGDAA